MTQANTVHIVGIGSDHGDDRIGWILVRRLAHSYPWPRQVHWHCLRDVQELLDRLDGQGTWVLVDAVCCAAAPGSSLRLTWPDDQLPALPPGNTHSFDVAGVLHMAQVLGQLPPLVVIWAIAGSCFDPGAPLSTALEAAVPALADRIAQDIWQLCTSEQAARP
ncbi:MAG: hypothetical protein C4296_11890 [Gemmataceae bacterium]